MTDNTLETLQLNHVAVHVANVEESVRFYRYVLQLQPIARPAFDFPGAWFRLGTDQELHLIGGRQQATVSFHRGTHFAVRVADLDAWEEHLIDVDATFLPRKTRPDGAGQIFVVDPDGHYIELCQLGE